MAVISAKGDDGVGTACRAAGQAIAHGVIGVGETRADGTHVSTLLVPDDVMSVTAAGRVAPARRNLVRFTLPAGTTAVRVASDSGGYVLDCDVTRWLRPCPRGFARLRPAGDAMMR